MVLCDDVYVQTTLHSNRFYGFIERGLLEAGYAKPLSAVNRYIMYAYPGQYGFNVWGRKIKFLIWPIAVYRP